MAVSCHLNCSEISAFHKGDNVLLDQYAQVPVTLTFLVNALDRLFGFCYLFMVVQTRSWPPNLTLGCMCSSLQRLSWPMTQVKIGRLEEQVQDS